jgi:hypothetical protein
MKTIPVLVLTAVSCLSLPHFTRGQALPFQQSPPPGTPMPVTPPTSGTAAATTTTPTSTAVTPIPDGFFLRDGKVYVIRDGAFSLVTNEQVLRIQPNGTVTGFDGRTWQIPAGQILTTDGRTVPVDPSLLTLDDRTRAATTITGENKSGLAPAGSGHPISPPGSASAPANTSDGFSQVPNSTGRGRTATNRGGGTFVDPGVTTLIDGQNPNATTTNQQTTTDRQTTGTNMDRTNTTGTTTNSNATPNQRASTGTNTGVNPQTTSPRSTTPNQRSSSGTSTTGTGTTSGGTSSSSGSSGSAGSGGSSSSGSGTSGGTTTR